VVPVVPVVPVVGWANGKRPKYLVYATKHEGWQLSVELACDSCYLLSSVECVEWVN